MVTTSEYGGPAADRRSDEANVTPTPRLSYRAGRYAGRVVVSTPPPVVTAALVLGQITEWHPHTPQVGSQPFVDRRRVGPYGYGHPLAGE
jgi:hypothetical protein